MGQQRGKARSGIGPIKSGLSGSIPASTPSIPKVPSATTSPLGTPAIGGQASFGINSIEKPFGGLRGGPSNTKRSADFDTDIDLPDTTVGLTPGSEDKEEEDTITAPTINDEEKRREAADKASEWLS
jgi:hypothetical protein